MTKYFTKLAAAAIVAGLIVPQAAMAKGKGSNGHSHHAKKSITFKSNSDSKNSFLRRGTSNGSNEQFGKLTTRKSTPSSQQVVRRVDGGQLNQQSNLNTVARIKKTQQGNQLKKLTQGNQFKQLQQGNQFKNIHHKMNGNNNHTKHHNVWNQNWLWNNCNNDWHHKGNWHGCWPIFWGGNYWNRYCNTYPVYYPTQTVVVSQPAGPAPIVEAAPIATEPATTGNADLVLEDLQLAAPATLLVGPAYRVTFRNQGTEAVGKFRVGLLAGMDGAAKEDSPRAVVEVAGLAAGEVSEVTIRLPRTAMQLAGSNGQPTAFTHLFAAVDIEGIVSELDKTNNAAIVERAQLEFAAR